MPATTVGPKYLGNICDACSFLSETLACGRKLWHTLVQLQQSKVDEVVMARV